VLVEGKRRSGVPVLVAGAQRLRAAKHLGWSYVDCVEVDNDDNEAELWEISENLHRSGLSKQERDLFIRRYAEALTRGRDQSSQNVPIESRREDGRGHRRRGIASTIAKEIGLSKKTVTRALGGSSATTTKRNPIASNRGGQDVRDGLKTLWASASQVDRDWFLDWATAQ
jgi:hypothetical protein